MVASVVAVAAELAPIAFVLLVDSQVAPLLAGKASMLVFAFAVA